MTSTSTSSSSSPSVRRSGGELESGWPRAGADPSPVSGLLAVAEALAQARQHVGAESPQESLLVVAGPVEHEVAETELDVRGDPFDDVVGIV